MEIINNREKFVAYQNHLGKKTSDHYESSINLANSFFRKQLEVQSGKKSEFDFFNINNLTDFINIISDVMRTESDRVENYLNSEKGSRKDTFSPEFLNFDKNNNIISAALKTYGKFLQENEERIQMKSTLTKELFYHFTQDMRFRELRQNLISVAKHISDDVWNHPNQSLEQAKNGWYPAYELYFGLYKESINVTLINANEIDLVIAEFVKKFQFPNPRPGGKNAYLLDIQNKNHQLNAPLRSLSKLLLGYNMLKNDNIISRTKFKEIILENWDLIVRQAPLFEKLLELEENYAKNKINDVKVNYSEGQYTRFDTQLLGIFSELGVVKAISNEEFLISMDIQCDNAKLLYWDIVSYEGFWEIKNNLTSDQLVQSYKEYMQVPEATVLKRGKYLDSKNPLPLAEIKWQTEYKQPKYPNEKHPYPHNRILFGAPGTGKSHTLNREALGENGETEIALLKYGGIYERVTFHPDYSYASFVGSYKPVSVLNTKGEEVISYTFVPGPFTRILVEALRNGRSEEIKPHLLIIEEINRANVAAVFGDIFQLLDRQEGVSEYPIQISEEMRKYIGQELEDNPETYSSIRLPDNLFIWATMNSADQGVFPMDTAFKRRWDFTYRGINENEDQIKDANFDLVLANNIQKVNWNKLRKAINTRLLSFGVNEDKLMGAYFISKNSLENLEIFKATFKNKVIMYLFDDAAKQKRTTLFSGATFPNLYSNICAEFETKGIDIFDSEVKNNYSRELSL